jgi:transposase
MLETYRLKPILRQYQWDIFYGTIHTLHPGDLVVMDNLSRHKSAAAVEAIEAVGADVVYLPPYSPDLNPIENIFSKVKQLIWGLKPRSLGSIVDAVAQVLPK